MRHESSSHLRSACESNLALFMLMTGTVQNWLLLRVSSRLKAYMMVEATEPTSVRILYKVMGLHFYNLQRNAYRLEIKLIIINKLTNK